MKNMPPKNERRAGTLRMSEQINREFGFISVSGRAEEKSGTRYTVVKAGSVDGLIKKLRKRTEMKHGQRAGRKAAGLISVFKRKAE